MKDVKNGEYDLNGNLFFDTSEGKITMTARDALTIAYTLFDSVGFEYDVLDEIESELN